MKCTLYNLRGKLMVELEKDIAKIKDVRPAAIELLKQYPDAGRCVIEDEDGTVLIDVRMSGKRS